jgi:hypothetical protein
LSPRGRNTASRRRRSLRATPGSAFPTATRPEPREALLAPTLLLSMSQQQLLQRATMLLLLLVMMAVKS